MTDKMDRPPTDKPEQESCPVTGLPVLRKPGWQNIRLSEGYFVSFGLIGEKILLIEPIGKADTSGLETLFVERERVLTETGLRFRAHVEISDYTKNIGTTDRKTRVLFTEKILEEEKSGYLLGFWVFSIPTVLKMIMKVGVLVFEHKTSVLTLADNYETAIRAACARMEEYYKNKERNTLTKASKLHWELKLEGLEIHSELIENDILYHVLKGTFREDHVPEMMKYIENNFKDLQSMNKVFNYSILNLENLEKMTWRARFLYVRGQNKIMEHHRPPHLMIMFGLNAVMNVITRISKQFMSFPVIIAESFKESLQIIERDRKKRASGPLPIDPLRRRKKRFTEDELTGFSLNLLQSIGSINWRLPGITHRKIDNSHPFKDVFDAISIIKTDFDNVLNEQKKIEKDILLSEEELRFITESSLDTIFLLSTTGKIIYVSPSIKELTGSDSKELIGSQFAKLITAEELPQFQKCLENAVKDNRVHSFRTFIRPLNGTLVPIEMIGHTIEKDGQSFCQGTIRDISDRLKIEREEKILRAHLHHADRLATIGGLSAGVAHELNEPLSSILGFAELSKKADDLPFGVRTDLDKIIEESLHARNIIKSLLAISRQETSLKNSLNLNKIIEEGLYFFESRCKKNDIELLKILSPDLPMIPSNHGQLRQVLMNLIFNAIHAIPKEGKLTLKTETMKNMVALTIENSGVGIPEKDQKNILGPFGATGEDCGGGPAFSIMQAIITKHGGTLHVDNTPGEVSRVIVQLPIKTETKI